MHHLGTLSHLLGHREVVLVVVVVVVCESTIDRSQQEVDEEVF